MTYRKGSTLNFTQRTASSFPLTFFVFQSEIPSPFPGYPRRPGPGRDAGRRVPGGTAAVRQHHAGGGSTSLSTWDVALPLPPPRLRPSHFLPQNHFLEVTPRAAPAVFKFRPPLWPTRRCVYASDHTGKVLPVLQRVPTRSAHLILTLTPEEGTSLPIFRGQGGRAVCPEPQSGEKRGTQRTRLRRGSRGWATVPGPCRSLYRPSIREPLRAGCGNSGYYSAVGSLPSSRNRF